MALTIKVLLENRLSAGADKPLIAKAGLSLLLQDGADRVLFDTGPDDSFLYNAHAAMGVDLSQLTATVLSHGHYDHCGGVSWLPDNSSIICHPQIANERYAALNLGQYRAKIKKLSLDIDYSRHSMQYSREPLQITEHLIWSGEITVVKPRAYGVLTGKDHAPDYVTDEGVLIYRSSRGLVIIIGCGHRGLVNIVSHCQKITGIHQIHAIIGGFHLRCASSRSLWKIRQFLKEEKPEQVIGCHCTGSWGRLWLPYGRTLATGDTILLDNN